MVVQRNTDEANIETKIPLEFWTAIKFTRYVAALSVLSSKSATGSQSRLLEPDLVARFPVLQLQRVWRRRRARHTHRRTDDLAVLARLRGNVVLHHWREYT